MISIPEFMQGIMSDDPAHDVTHNFSKMMVLYHLLGGRSDIKISSTHEDGTMFHIAARNQTSARDLNTYINGTSNIANGCTYTNCSEWEQRQIDIRIQKQ